jgi:hypothetical protein
LQLYVDLPDASGRSNPDYSGSYLAIISNTLSPIHREGISPSPQFERAKIIPFWFVATPLFIFLIFIALNKQCIVFSK